MAVSGIYKIINMFNGKFYLGSSENLLKRKREHFWALVNNKHDNQHLQNAFNKYGEENFKFEIIEIVYNKSDLKSIEQKYIDEFNVCDRSIGYNINQYASGGGLIGEANPNFGKSMSDEQKEKIRNTMTGRKYSTERCRNISQNRKGKCTGSANFNYGRMITEEEKALHSEKMKGRFSGENNPFYGKSHKKETIEKIRQSRIGKTGDMCSNSIKIVQLTVGNLIVKQFNAMQDAQRETGIWAANIQKCCAGKAKTAGGYRWQYLSEYEKSNQESKQLSFYFA